MNFFFSLQDNCNCTSEFQIKINPVFFGILSTNHLQTNNLKSPEIILICACPRYSGL